jgi:hypothetical protein
MDWDELCDGITAVYQRRLQTLELVRKVRPDAEGLAWQYPERFRKFLKLIEPQESGCWSITSCPRQGQLSGGGCEPRNC